MSEQRPEPAGRADRSMGLLVDLSAAALDPSYAEAARRPRTAGARAGASLSTHVVVGLALVGLGTGVAAAQARQRADEVGAARKDLVSDVRERTRATDRLAAQAAALRDAVSRSRAQALSTDARGRQAAAQVAALELVAGAEAVRGPGLVVTLDDAASAEAGTESRGGQTGEGRVYDRDLQEVVNALWAAGAEAISLNDQRVTSQTAIRSAGEAVLVDLRPLSPPYVLRAVGEVDALEAAFASSATARKLQTWTSLYGLRFSVHRAGELRLPAGPSPDLRLARPGGAS